VTRDGKRAAESRVEIAQLIQPNDANPIGTVFGGKVMALMDEAAAMAAQRHARKVVVTAGIDALDFRAPAKVGHFLIVRARVNLASHTSMEVGVTVFAEDPLTGETLQTASGFLTFVALDGFGRPSSVPPLIVDDSEAKEREAAAKRRRRTRLRRRRNWLETGKE